MIKNLVLILATFISMSFGYENGVDNILIPPSFNQNSSLACNYGQCHAIAKSTNMRCKHCVSNSGDRYCYQHR